MSKISTVYDFFVSEMATLFPNKTKIPRPYSLSDNLVNFLRDGYGVKVNGDSFAAAELCKITLDYNFSIVLTREVVRTDSNDVAGDDATKSILEDAFTIKRHFYDVDTISIPDDLDLVDIQNMSGINEFIGGKIDFKTVEVNLIAKIREDY